MMSGYDFQRSWVLKRWRKINIESDWDVISSSTQSGECCKHGIQPNIV